MNKRDVVFIGHANPEDNEFTLWLYAKLKNEGYNVECDLTCLTGGEDDYWKVLQDILDNRACKYLLVLSENTFKKQGVIDEWEQVKSVSRKTGLADFVMIAKTDDVAFDIRIGVNVKNHFRFDESWAKAFKKLIIKLNKDGIPKQNNNPLSIEEWIKNKYTTSPKVFAKKEIFYSNWLSIPNLPQNIYIYKFTNDALAKAILKEIESYPVIRHDNYLITFLSEIPQYSIEEDLDIEYTKKMIVETKSAFQKYDSDQFPVYDDLKRFMIRLLKDSIQRFLINRGLNVYEMSQNTKCFYYKKGQLELDKVYFNYNNKETWKQLIGEYFGEAIWHYGISVHPMLYPDICFSLKAHLVFSDDGENLWSGKKRIHRARQSKGKSFFNKEWRSLMLAFLRSLSDDGISISIPLAENFVLQLPVTTIQFYSEFGYVEPKEDARLVPVDYYEDEDIEDNFDDDDDDDGVEEPIEKNKEKKDAKTPEI